MSSKDMRTIYVETLIELAKNDKRIVLVESDFMKASGTKPFKEYYPERSINVGIAEANMIGVAVGLSTFGKVPFANSLTSFATRRCYDQLFVSAGFARQNIKVVGMDPGVAAEFNGGTHMSFEDIGVLRNIPDMRIFEPVDGIQLKNILPQIVDHYGPVYIRLYRKYLDDIFGSEDKFELGKAYKISDGDDVTIIASGLMVQNSVEAVRQLKEEGINAALLNIHTIKPLDKEAIIKEAMKTKAIVCAENHSILNGLGSAVAETLSENYPTPIVRVGVKDHFGEVGKKEFLMEKYGMTVKDIGIAAKKAIAAKERGYESAC